MEFFRDNPQMLLVGGVLLITMFLISRITKRRRRGPASIVSPHEQLERLKQARGMRGDLEQLMVEIEQMAKRMGAHLDAKSMRIERLLDQADQRIEQLQQLEARSLAQNDTQNGAAAANKSANGTTSDSLAAAADAERGDGGGAGDPSDVDAHRASDGSQASQAPSAAVAGSAAAASVPAVDALPDDPLARSVYELADKGNDPQQIAKALQEHVGKIELILALRTA